MTEVISWLVFSTIKDLQWWLELFLDQFSLQSRTYSDDWGYFLITFLYNCGLTAMTGVPFFIRSYIFSGWLHMKHAQNFLAALNSNTSKNRELCNSWIRRSWSCKGKKNQSITMEHLHIQHGISREYMYTTKLINTSDSLKWKSS